MENLIEVITGHGFDTDTLSEEHYFSHINESFIEKLHRFLTSEESDI